jgi:hypothetical protein
MHPEYIATGAAILVSAVSGLIAWGVRGQIGTLQEKFRADLAEQENRIIARINGTYTRTPLHMDLVARVDRIEGRVDEIT